MENAVERKELLSSSCKKGGNTKYMLTNGHNYLLVKNTQMLQKTFKGDWTLSFAIRVPAREMGFWPRLLQKGAESHDRSPAIGMYADTYGLYATILTEDGRLNTDGIYMSPNLQIGV